MIYFKLLISFLQVGAFSFGGGYAAMPLIQHQVININNWLTMSDFTNLVTISQMTPGPIALNAATFVGTKVAGIQGALIATLGCILPSCIFVTVIACIYEKYKEMSLLQGILNSLRPAVVALIANAGVAILIQAFFINGKLNFMLNNISIRSIIYFGIGIFILRKFKLNPIGVMVICGLMELLYSIFITVT